jgi:hypothetical protein
MGFLFPRPALVSFLIFLTVIAGCSSTAPIQGTHSPAFETAVPENIHTAEPDNAGQIVTSSPKEGITGQLSSVQSTNPVWLEAYRMFRNMKSTEYVHPPYLVDDAAGVYKFDCLGFVDHVLINADPDGYREIGRGANPSIESYAAYFNRLDAKTPDSQGWTKVIRPADLEPGDICLWLKPVTLDTGHMWIIAGTPSVNPKRTDEVLVRIFDSSSAHSDDSRTVSVFKTGLGSGILGMMVDGKGSPIGLYWDGGVSTSAGEKDTTIICGRLNR